MRVIVFSVFMVLGFPLLLSAQNSNKLLDFGFWKSQPSVEAVQGEILKGNSPSQANPANFDAVCMAINNQADFQVIQFLLTQEGNGVDKKTHDGRTYLHWAASSGNVDVVKYLLKKGWTANLIDEKGASPLAFAAMNGQVNPEIFKLFFMAGISVNEVYQDGANILLLSIAGDKDLSLTNYLISQGLSIQSKDEYGRTAFDYAAKSGDIELLKKVLAHHVKPTPNALIFAAQGSRRWNSTIETFQYLIEDLDLQPNSLSVNNENVFHYLARKPKQLEIIQYLLEKGTNAEQVDKFGNNPLMNAAQAKDIDVVKLFIQQTKDVNHSNLKKETALMLASQYSSVEIVDLLLQSAANPALISKSGNCIYYLIQSYRANNSEEFDKKWNLLLEKGVNFKSLQADGSSIYHVAIAKQDEKLLEKIGSIQLNINIQDEEGMSVLHKAALIAKDDKILKFLVSQGADKSLLTGFDETAYDLASENETLKSNNISIDFLK